MHRLLSLAFAAIFIVSTAAIENHPRVLAASSTQIAAAINGNIVLFQADGSGKQIVTDKGIDGSPKMSPDGSLVAFLRWPGGLHADGLTPSRHIVMLGTPGAGGRYTVNRFSPRSPLTTPGRSILSWQPGVHSPGVAWYEAGNIAWRQPHQSMHWALSVGPASPLDRSSHIAWSPNGQEIATAIGPGQGAGYPTTLHVVVGNPVRHTQRTITIRFRPGILGSGPNPARGSFPVGDGLAFADNHHLLVGTISKGEGYFLTGVFIVPDTGGIARLVLGNGNGVHGYPPFASSLANATQFQLSPNGKYTATDPNNHFWISGDVAAPRTVAVPLGRSCALSQWSWLPDSSGLAYVTACTIPGAGTIHYRLTLATVSRTGGSPHILYTLRSTNQSAIDLAPVYRCVACGG